MTSREQFEAQIRLHTDESEIEERLKKANGGMNYAHPETDVAWIWWKASREAVSVEIPENKLLSSSILKPNAVYGLKRKEVIECVRAAGIKVKGE